MGNKKKFSIIAGMLIIVGIIGSLLSYHLNDAEPVSEKRVIDNQQVSKITVDTDNTRVLVYPTKEDKIKVTLVGKKSSNTSPLFETKVRNSTLSIINKEKQLSWFNFDIFEVLKPLTLTVYLPEKEYELLQVSSSNGYVSAEQLNAKSVDFQTDNGRIELNDISSQTVVGETSNGRLDMKDVIAQTVRVNTDNGGVTLDHVEGELTGETSNGSILLNTAELDRNIKFKTDNGKITIETEKDPTNVQFNVSVDNGKVNILDKYKGTTIVGNGDHVITLTTSNGSISVTK